MGNTNMLVSQYIINGIDFKNLSIEDGIFIEHFLKFSPRKCFDFDLPILLNKIVALGTKI